VGLHRDLPQVDVDLRRCWIPDPLVFVFGPQRAWDISYLLLLSGMTVSDL